MLKQGYILYYMWTLEHWWTCW